MFIAHEPQMPIDNRHEPHSEGEFKCILWKFPSLLMTVCQHFGQCNAEQTIKKVLTPYADTLTFTTRTTESERRIDLVLDLDQRIQYHLTAVVEIDIEFLQEYRLR